MIRAEFFEVDAQNADLRQAVLRDAGLSGSNLRGANLTNAIFAETALIEARMDDTTIVRGATGSLYGPIRWSISDSEEHMLNGIGLHDWLSDRGADVVVLEARLRDAGEPHHG